MSTPKALARRGSVVMGFAVSAALWFPAGSIAQIGVVECAANPATSATSALPTCQVSFCFLSQRSKNHWATTNRCTFEECGGPLTRYSSEQEGWHDYLTRNVVCPAELNCTEEEMVDYLSRFAVPGQDPQKPIQNEERTNVVDPRPCTLSNYYPCLSHFTSPDTVETRFITSDGTALRNETLSNHALHDGVIEREIVEIGGTWYVFTHGYGNNRSFLTNSAEEMARINSIEGEAIFNYVDRQMKDYIKQDKLEM